MTPSILESVADVIGRELAAARAAWRKEREIAAAETRQTIAELRAEVAELNLRLHEKAQTIKDGEPGPQGPPGERGQDGSDGQDGADGKDGAPGKAGQFPIPRAWSAQIHYAGQIVTHDGSTWQACRDTAAAPPGEDWSPLALKGSDAPVGKVCGRYDPAASYRAFDLVNADNCEWRAKYDEPGPLPGDGWAQAARQGKPGPKGERGERGEPGAQLVGLKRDGWQLVAIMSDGSTIRCDDRPLLELYHAEVA
jgi:hypothetical protein